MPHKPLTAAHLSLLAGLCACSGGSSTGPSRSILTDADAPHDASRDADACEGVDAGLDADATAAQRDGASALDAASADVISTDANSADVVSTDAGGYRNQLLQPFATSSIWNTPIGSGAQYVAAAIQPVTGQALGTDDENIVLDPTATSVDV